MGSIWCIRDRVGAVREGVGAVSEEKWAVILWLRRRCWRDVCPRGCDIIEDYPPTLTSPQLQRDPPTISNSTAPLAIISTIVRTSTVRPAIVVVVCRSVLHLPPAPNRTVVGLIASVEASRPW
jgi:hypothetical protein